MADLLHGRLFRLIIAAILLFGVAALSMDAPRIILISNTLVCLSSLAVVVSFFPLQFGALSAREPDRGHFFSVAVFATAFAQFCLRTISIVARDFGHPDIVNTLWMSAVIDTTLFGEVLFLFAAHAIEGQIPRKQWVRIGIAVASAFGLFLLILSLRVPIEHPSFRPL